MHSACSCAATSLPSTSPALYKGQFGADVDVPETPAPLPMPSKIVAVPLSPSAEMAKPIRSYDRGTSKGSKCACAFACSMLRVAGSKPPGRWAWAPSRFSSDRCDI